MAKILVLAGVNGAGKSTLLGQMLREDGADWFNPDAFGHGLEEQGWEPGDANVEAWHEGVRRLRAALSSGTDHAFETTLGGNTIRDLLREACVRHEVTVWFCGLSSADLHVQRVAARVAEGGHDIPAHKIRARYDSSRRHLVELIPGLAALRVYDNSRPADARGRVEPRLVLDMDRTAIRYPATSGEMLATPDWAKAIVEAAFEAQGDRGGSP